MRAITIRQPWAEAVARAIKLIENRSAGTAYRGPLAIHAGLGWSARGEHDARVLDALGEVDRGELPMGTIVAVAELVDAHPDGGCCRPWGESTYQEAGGRLRTVVHHLVLEDVVPVRPPVPCRGALGLWLVPEALAYPLLALR